jgi:hypothetical protein
MTPVDRCSITSCNVSCNRVGRLLLIAFCLLISVESFLESRIALGVHWQDRTEALDVDQLRLIVPSTSCSGVCLGSSKGGYEDCGENEESLSLCAKNRSNDSNLGRRSFITACKCLGLTSALSIQAASVPPAWAAIDVSGLQKEGGKGNPAIASQLKSYDGSGTARVNEIKTSSASKTSGTPSLYSDLPEPYSESTVATSALRVGEPRLSKLGLAGSVNRYDGRLVAPKGSKSSLFVSFDFPSDWLQLDRLRGGVEYVDQRNGDKLYLLRANLPPDTTLAAVPKQFFGDSIFDQQGSIVKGGQIVEGYKVTSSNLITENPTRRRLKVKYSTVTGNGLSVERRGLVDVYEVDGVLYMLMTSSNANKFEAGGRERDTVEGIVDSFRLSF